LEDTSVLLKLKFEFNILNQLVDFTTRGPGPQELAFPGSLHCDAINSQVIFAQSDHNTDISLGVFGEPIYACPDESIHGDISLQKTSNAHPKVKEAAGSQKSIRELKGCKDV
jgi:hypothetical protein